MREYEFVLKVRKSENVQVHRVYSNFRIKMNAKNEQCTFLLSVLLTRHSLSRTSLGRLQLLCL